MTVVEFVGPQGSVVLRGFPVGLREKTGERVLARNLATNPSFEVASGEVVVRENLYPYSKTLSWNVVGGTSAAYTHNGLPGTKISAGYANASTYPLTTEEAAYYSARVGLAALDEDSAGTTVGVQLHDGNRYVSERGYVELPAVGDYVSVETLARESNVAGRSLRIYVYPPSNPGGALFISEEAVFKVSGAGVSGGPYFDKNTAASGDFTYWERPGGGAQEVAQGVAATPTLSGDGGIVWSSTDGAHHGARIARCRLAGAGAIGVILKDITVSSDVVYTLKIWARAMTRDTIVRPRIANGWGGEVTLVKGEWQELAVTTSGTNPANNGLFLEGGKGHRPGDIIDIDEHILVEGTYDGPYFDESTPDHDPIHYRKEADGTVTKYQALYKPLPEWIFEDLTGWYDLTEDKVPVDERPQGHGAFNVARSYRSSLAVTVKAHILGEGNTDVISEFERMAVLGVDGPVEMRVTDSVRTTSRTVSIRNVEAEDEHGHDVGTVTIDCLARDPRRYSIDDQWVTGSAAKPSGGLVWPAVWPLVWAGDAGSDGRITLTNEGKKLSSPVYRVYGGFDGFTLTNVGTQQRVGFRWTVPSGSYVELNFARRTATLDGQADVTRYLTVREWWDVPPGKTVTAQLEVDGAYLGPYFAGMVRSAW